MAGQHLRSTSWRPGWRHVAAIIGVLVLGLLLGAAFTVLTTDDPRVSTSGAPGEPSGAPEPTPPLSGADDEASSGLAGATPDPEPITIAFVGDINAEGSLLTRLEQAPADFVGPFADVLRNADLAIGNLEAAVTTGGSPIAKEFAFRAPPGILDALRAGGIDVVSAANNHGLDYGAEGLQESIAVQRAQADGMLIGIGADEDEAFAPYRAEVAGHRVAVIAATQVIDGTLIDSWTATAEQGGLASAKRVDRLVQEVSAARADSDTVIVYLHWGTETEVCPNSLQRELAQTLVDAGADVVVGGHAHRVQSAGRLGDALVGYGLGNFLLGAVSDDSAKTGVLLVRVDGRRIVDYEWRPGRIADRVPQPLEGPAAGAAVAEWNSLRGCTGLAD